MKNKENHVGYTFYFLSGQKSVIRKSQIESLQSNGKMKTKTKVYLGLSFSQSIDQSINPTLFLELTVLKRLWLTLTCCENAILTPITPRKCKQRQRGASNVSGQNGGNIEEFLPKYSYL